MSTATLPQGGRIRGISVQQPHATCILTGAKGIENRPRPWFVDSSAVVHGVRPGVSVVDMSVTGPSSRNWF